MNPSKTPTCQQNQQPAPLVAKALQNLITLHQQITRDLNHALTAYQEILHNTQVVQENLINLYQTVQGNSPTPLPTITSPHNQEYTEDLEKINRVIANAANQANILSINTAIIAEKQEAKDGINVIAKELQTLAEQLKLVTEELSNKIKIQ